MGKKRVSFGGPRDKGPSAESAKTPYRPNSSKDDLSATGKISGAHIADEIRTRWLSRQIRTEAAQNANLVRQAASRAALIEAMPRTELETCLKKAESLIPRLRTELEHVILARDEALLAVRKGIIDLQCERDFRVEVAKLLYSPSKPIQFSSKSKTAPQETETSQRKRERSHPSVDDTTYPINLPADPDSVL